MFGARTIPEPIGLWPVPWPFPADAHVALWLDGSTAGAAIARALSATGTRWTALVARYPELPAPAVAAARRQAEGAGGVREVESMARFIEPAGWAGAFQAARHEGATWILAPLTVDEATPPLPLRLAAAEQALITWGLSGVRAPLLGWSPTEVARLALALEVDWPSTWDCRQPIICGLCPGCRGRARAFKQLGQADTGRGGPSQPLASEPSR